MIKLKRVYDSTEPDDGCRYLVDRLWPRGVSKDSLKLDGWFKDLAPSDSLRRWFNHDPDKWDEFRRRYFIELESQTDKCRLLMKEAKKGVITLLFSARDMKYNNAVALAEFLKKSKSG
ncbi:MAG: DUF488 domain-containing protein [Nitrospirae bacterium]|nr:DUF488 domain-containing protein [Nitrospirota bacterium]